MLNHFAFKSSITPELGPMARQEFAVPQINPHLGFGLNPYHDVLPCRQSDADKSFKEGLKTEMAYKIVLDVAKGFSLGASNHVKMSGAAAGNPVSEIARQILHGPHSPFNFIPEGAHTTFSQLLEFVNAVKIKGYKKTERDSLEAIELAEKSTNLIEMQTQLGINESRKQEAGFFKKEKWLLLAGSLGSLATLPYVTESLTSLGMISDPDFFLLSAKLGICAAVFASRYYDVRGLIAGIQSADFLISAARHEQEQAKALASIRPANTSMARMDHAISQEILKSFSPVAVTRAHYFYNALTEMHTVFNVLKQSEDKVRCDR